MWSVLVLGCRAVRDAPSLYAEEALDDCERGSAAVPVVQKGLNANVFAPATDGLDDAARVERTFDEVAELGVDTVRYDLSWAWVEPDPDRFDWTVPDLVFRAAEERNVTVVPILGYAPGWAAARRLGDAGGRAPEDLDDWGDYVAEVAERYGPGSTVLDRPVRTWEIWNEANLDWFFAPTANPHDYAFLLARASRELRAADPDAVVVASGLSPIDPADRNAPVLGWDGFLGALVDDGVYDCVDVVNVHPYLFDGAGPGTLDERYLDGLHAFLDDHGERPVWLTEFGYIVGEWTDEAGQAQAARELLELRGEGSFDGAFWFSLHDLSKSDSYGLVDTEGRRRPAFEAWAE